MARTLPNTEPTMKKSLLLSVPFCTSTVATGPRPLSTRDSSTVPLAGASGLAFSSRKSATSRIISSSLSRFFFCFAETSTNSVSPPHSAGINPRSASWRFPRLRHHAVVGRNHEHDDVRYLRAARTHPRKGFVARRIHKHHALFAHLHLVGADVLGDASGFARRYVLLADGIEQT